MSNAFDFDGSWERVAAELRACKESQQRAYGGVDSATLGRYLAGEMSEAERATLEQTLAELPELRKLTDLVQGVLSDLAPIEDAPPVPAPAPVILPLPAAKPRRKPSWLRRYAPVAAAACLLVALAGLMPRAGYLSAPRDEVAALNGVARIQGAGEMAGLESKMVFLEGPAPLDLPAEAAASPVQPSPPAPGGKAASQPVPPPSRQTDQLPQVVALYHAQGEVARAEKTLRHEYHACKKQFGPADRKTKWAARQLAGVYQFALNESGDAAPGNAGEFFFRPTPVVRARSTAQVVREQINNQPAQKVSETVVLVLKEALEGTENNDERLALTRALGELGPAARSAVPLLCERLRKSADPRERVAILAALDRMGPAAQSAVPTLVALVHSGEKRGKVKAAVADRKGDARDAERGWLSATEEKLARQVLARLKGREARVGVFDGAGLFSLKDTIRATHALRGLARESDLEVRVETFTPDRNPAASSAATPGPWALHVVFLSSGRSVEVRLGKSVREQGVDPDRLGKQLAESCRRGECDAALSALVQAARKVKPVESRK